MASQRSDGKAVTIGIDLGTTYSSMAYVGIQVSCYGMPIPKPEIATDKTGTRVEHQFVPSDVCAYLKDGELRWAVGLEARSAAARFGRKAHLYRYYKVLIGAPFLDEEYEANLDPDLRSNLRSVTPDAVAQKVIEYLYFLAFGSDEAVLHDYGIAAVSVSVPALWPADRARHVQDLVRAALKLAAVEEVRVIEEPIAALYHQIRPQAHLLQGREKYVMVIDYGGGTCDVAVVKIKKDADRLQAQTDKVAEVIGRGSLDRGGVQIDERIADRLDKELSGRDLQCTRSWDLEEAERLKIAYANSIRDLRARGTDHPHALEHRVRLDSSNSSDEITIRMSAEEFAELVSPELAQLAKPVNEALQDANRTDERKGREDLGLKDMSHVFLAGGTPLLLLVKDEVRRLLEEAGSLATITDIDPRKAIAYGAALHAHYRETGMGLGIGVTLKESIWLKDIFGRGILVAKKGTVLPCAYSRAVRIARRQFKEGEVALYSGPSRSISKDTPLYRTTYRVDLPARFWTQFVFEVAIDESGQMDLVLTRSGHPEDTLTLRRITLPTHGHTDEIAERLGNPPKE